MRQWSVTALLLATSTICVVVASDQPKLNTSGATGRTPLKSASNPSKGEGGAQASQTSQGIASKPTHHEHAAKQLTEALRAAYQRGDAKAFANTFTMDGEYLDAHGEVFHGRKRIAEDLAILFRASPESTIEIELTSTRSIGRNLIAADAVTHFKKSPESVAVPGKCHLICVREADSWLIASLHESLMEDEAWSHHSRVSQLEWLVGDWISEGQEAHVHFSCRWDESEHFLLRDFTIEVAGARPLSGTQRIGYDPITQQLKFWTFDSAGGFSDGFVHGTGETWTLKSSGVTPDGQLARATNIWTRIDNNRMTSETTDHIVRGEQVHDDEKLTIVRKPHRTAEGAAAGDRRKN